jgi:DNA invertase Pin-like site-specific DNA recombinase
VSDGVITIEALKRRKVRFVSLDIRVNTSTPAGRFFFNILLSVAELEREFARERAAEIISYRKKNKLPLGKHSPVGWKIVGKGVRESGTMKSTRRFVLDLREREYVAEIYAKKAAGWSVLSTSSMTCCVRDTSSRKRSRRVRAIVGQHDDGLCVCGGGAAQWHDDGVLRQSRDWQRVRRGRD